TVAVSPTLASGNQLLILVPTVPLRGGTLYTVTVAGVMDLSGRAMPAPATTTFTTGPGVDFTATAVSLVDPVTGATGVPTNALVRVRFTKPAAVTGANLQVYPATTGLNVVVPGTVTLSSDGLVATFTPSSALQAGTQYGVFLTGITDLIGQGLSGGNGTYATF